MKLELQSKISEKKMIKCFNYLKINQHKNVNYVHLTILKVVIIFYEEEYQFILLSHPDLEDTQQTKILDKSPFLINYCLMSFQNRTEAHDFNREELIIKGHQKQSKFYLFVNIASGIVKMLQIKWFAIYDQRNIVITILNLKEKLFNTQPEYIIRICLYFKYKQKRILISKFYNLI
ncbi:unnamed protein product [Paramecium octaurelia]|uniref:Uncharacterized protein n=1 Tax=Paramecium octaurelia TaxID=43137 RepID=A0A8S1W5T1_PAROT|nr:unnamed protein product [Paramecium octaurelia]